jgi:ATP-dependent Lhr-like helicase
MDHIPFHPAIAQWFSETLGTPTSAQTRGWKAIRQRRHALIAAPTGSGKTLAAFLSAIDDLFCDGLAGTLTDQVRVVYVSPLKALSADIHRNLAEPRTGIRRVAQSLGLDTPRITAAVRTGDTPAPERAAMLKTPPHILVTTPESLYLLLTAARSREMLRTVRTVIVDEIHAVLASRRGSHLALSLERLERIAETSPQRIGLSATQTPIDEVGRFLVGAARIGPDGVPDCAIVDEGHRRAMDIGLELPGSPLEAVMAHECWEEYYDRLSALVHEHRTTLIFVNTRRLSERLAKHLSERLGEDAVAAHHGSLSKEKRLDAEERLKTGRLKVLVATSSLELGIDIGHVDLVCQIGSPRAIATFLQRVGRSGHTIHGMPKGRLFPTTRDDLVEGAALIGAVRSGALDRLCIADGSLDVLAQQVVAESAAGDVAEDDLFALVRRAYPYRALPRRDFDSVLDMLANGFATRRGRRGALIHRDEVNARVRGRRSARLSAITSGGAIPDNADYRVVLEPDDLFIGTLNEDFAIESTAGDVFQLGNASWRIARVMPGVVRVQDAKGQPPTIPFWLGEAPARSAELSKGVSDLRKQVEVLLQTEPVRLKPDPTESGQTADRLAPNKPDPTPSDQTSDRLARLKPDPTESGQTADLVAESGRTVALAKTRTDSPDSVGSAFRRTADWLEQQLGISTAAAAQIATYLGESFRMLGVLPTQDTIVLERFFDESGRMQLVLHAPFGNRVNRAWGLALRKRFCRQFNFELQAAATEEGLLLSLGPQHSFPLADVFRYLHPATVRDILIQAFLDAPVFQTRWRWNATISLAVPRNRGGRKVPPALQRMQADDLMAAVFPDAAACLENIPGDRQVPDHPLVNQTVRDCLEEAMDLAHLEEILGRIHAGTIQCVSRDMPEPSPLCSEILGARPYAFLDDAPLEERRAQAVYARRATEPRTANDLGALDPEAIARVAAEAWPDARDTDELHDALLTAGFMTVAEVATQPDSRWNDWLAALTASGRATRASARPAEAGSHAALDMWVAAERLPEILALYEIGQVPPFAWVPPSGGTTRPTAVHVPAEAGTYRITIDPPITPPSSRLAQPWTRDTALVELIRGRLSIVGPTTVASLAAPLAMDAADVEAALHHLEAEGVVLRGAFTPHAGTVLEWCERRLLSRIHRYTLNRLRAEIEPVAPSEFMRFLFEWQHVTPAHRARDVDGLRAVLEQLDGFEAAADAWEREILPARLERYDRAWLDTLCFSGYVAWARMSRPSPAGTEPLSGRPVRATPIALYLRAHAAAWQRLRPLAELPALSPDASRVHELLRQRGALFGDELGAHSGVPLTDVKRALAELVAAGLAASDAFAGLRDMVAGTTRTPDRLQAAGRWSALALDLTDVSRSEREDAIECQAWALLRRYGVVFRRLLARETNPATWRELALVYRRLEARGDIRGGRFVAGLSGEQFALPDAVTHLREVRRSKPSALLTTICGADPLNLSGVITPGDRISAVATTRIVLCDGVPLAALEGDYIRPLSDYDPALAGSVATALAGRAVPAITSGYIGRAG